MPYAKRKIDANQKRIVSELRRLGYSVALTHELGRGFPDIVVGKWGFNILVEVKSSMKAHLTKDEKNFWLSWNGQICVATSTREVIEGFAKCFSKVKRITKGCGKDLKLLEMLND
jgi:hypothetical protein